MSDFEKLLEQSQAELATKTEAHASAWHFGTEEDWGLAQDEGKLILTFTDGVEATAPAQIIGSYNSNDDTWMWAWANPSIVESLTENSRRLKAYGGEHGIERLTAPQWTGEEADCWAMIALATKLCDAQGAYRGPVGDTGTYVFMTFGEVKLSKADS